MLGKQEQKNVEFDEHEFDDFETVESQEKTEKKPDKWFAVKIIASSPSKAGLKKLMKKTDPKKYPVIIRGNIKPVSVDINTIANF